MLMFTLAMLLSYSLGILVVVKFTGIETQKSIREYILLKSFLHDSLKISETGDADRVTAVFNQLRSFIRKPIENEYLTEKTPFEILNSKSGSCDQQSLLFNHLLNCIDIKADVLHLYGCDTVSHHTISCVYINNEPTYWDLFCGHIFRSENGRFYRFSDLSALEQDFEGCSSIDYACVYSLQIPFKVASTNVFSDKMKFYKWWIDSYFKFPGKMFLQKIVS